MNSDARFAVAMGLFIIAAVGGMAVFMVFLWGWIAVWTYVGLAALAWLVSLVVRWIERGDELHPERVVPLPENARIE